MTSNSRKGFSNSRYLNKPPIRYQSPGGADKTKAADGGQSPVVAEEKKREPSLTERAFAGLPTGNQTLK